MLVNIDEIKFVKNDTNVNKDLDYLIEDIEKNGLQEYVVVSEDMILIDGKKRLEALRRMGTSMVEVQAVDVMEYENYIMQEIKNKNVKKTGNRLNKINYIVMLERLLKIQGKNKEFDGRVFSGADSFTNLIGYIAKDIIGLCSRGGFRNIQKVIEKADRNLIESINDESIAINSIFTRAGGQALYERKYKGKEGLFKTQSVQEVKKHVDMEKRDKILSTTNIKKKEQIVIYCTCCESEELFYLVAKYCIKCTKGMKKMKKSAKDYKSYILDKKRVMSEGNKARLEFFKEKNINITLD